MHFQRFAYKFHVCCFPSFFARVKGAIEFIFFIHFIVQSLACINYISNMLLFSIFFSFTNSFAWFCAHSLMLKWTWRLSHDNILMERICFILKIYRQVTYFFGFNSSFFYFYFIRFFLSTLYLLDSQSIESVKKWIASSGVKIYEKSVVRQVRIENLNT